MFLGLFKYFRECYRELVDAEHAAGAPQRISWPAEAALAAASEVGQLALYDVVAQPVRDISAKFEGHAVLLQEVTLRHRREAELELHALVFEAAHDATVIFDAAGDVHAVNLAFCALTGWDADAVVGQPVRGLLASAEPPAWLSVPTGEWRGEQSLRAADGRTVDLCCDVVASGPSGGRRYVLSGADVTKLKAAEERVSSLATHDALTPATATTRAS